MAYRVIISGGTILEECIEHVSFNVDTSNDFNSRDTSVRNSMIITGKVDTEEGTAALYKWALLPATNPDCYKEITVEHTKDNQLVRKVCFSKAFVVDYSENYSNYSGVGTFTIYIRQLRGKDIECVGQTYQPSTVKTGVIEKVEDVEKEIEAVKEQNTVAGSPEQQNKSVMSFTDRIAKQKEIQDNINIEQIEYGSSDLSKTAIEFRKANGIFTARNVSVFEYTENGAVKTIVMASERGAGHAERLIAKSLEEMGVQPSQITRIFSELEPCSAPGGYCKRFIQKTFPQAKVSYCFEYGVSAASRSNGINLLKQAVSNLSK